MSGLRISGAFPYRTPAWDKSGGYVLAEPFKEYPHETALRLKREAASDLFDAVAAYLAAYDAGTGTVYVEKQMRRAFAKASGSTDNG